MADQNYPEPTVSSPKIVIRPEELVSFPPLADTRNENGLPAANRPDPAARGSGKPAIGPRVGVIAAMAFVGCTIFAGTAWVLFVQTSKPPLSLPPEYRNATAIEKVLTSDKALSKSCEDRIKSGGDRLDAIDSMIKGMNALDFSNCPADFREAYARHCFAWKRMEDQMRSEPQSFMEGVWTGALNALLRHELDGGEGRIEQARNERSNALAASWGEVKALAARYGAKIPQ